MTLWIEDDEMALDRAAFNFFRTHTGGIVGQNALTAAALARAEVEARDRGWQFEWAPDDDADMSFVDTWSDREREEYWKQEHYAERCVLSDEHGHHLASLYGIVDADQDYRRVIEAELADEALDDERRALALTVA